MQGFETVAKALNDNNLCRAAIALVQTRIPPLPDASAAERMAATEQLAKAGSGYLTQPRVPAGQPGAGQWTDGLGEVISGLAERGLPWLLRASSRLVAPLAIAAGVLFPDNEHLESHGAIPGFSRLSYGFSEGRLTLFQNDEQGGVNRLYSGLPDKDGLYRTEDGTVVGRAVGNSFMLDGAGVAAISTSNARSSDVTDGFTNGPSATFIKPPPNAWDSTGPKAPGHPGGVGDYADPKEGPNWAPNPNGLGWGWESKDGKVWVPTGQGGAAHGGPHWDVQDPRTRDHENVRPPKSSD